MFTLLHNALDVIDQLPSEAVNLRRTLTDFTGAEQIDSWAKEALTLLGTGMIKGNDENLYRLIPPQEQRRRRYRIT